MDILQSADPNQPPAGDHAAKAVFPSLSTAPFAEFELRDAAEMSEMMKALNIDPVEAEFQYRRLYYGMEANCAGCRDKKRCRTDLAHGQASENFRDYCENETLLNEMRADPDVLLQDV
ncbi:DUF6455 family protein [Martelella limonii]|uniref:DUF6455 family protein n=1 Tax=Martelella limonii TaxID=1647649 RepID=UPI001581244C|nr:DUF6455 family protein [Martelella limonii]